MLGPLLFMAYAMDWAERHGNARSNLTNNQVMEKVGRGETRGFLWGSGVTAVVLAAGYGIVRWIF